MSSRLEPAALLVAPAVLVAARLAGIDALAVWCAFAVCVMLPGWGAMRLLRIERGLGLSGAAVVSTSLGLAIWIAPLAAAFAVHLPLTAPLVAVLIAAVVLCSVAVTTAAAVRPGVASGRRWPARSPPACSRSSPGGSRPG